AREAVGARVAGVLRERVRGHRELGEGREEPLGQRLAALVAEDLPGPEVLEEIAGLLADAARALARHVRPPGGAANRKRRPPRPPPGGAPSRGGHAPPPSARRARGARSLGRAAAGRVAEASSGLCRRAAPAVAAAEPAVGGEAEPMAERFFAALVAREFLPN